MKNRWRILVALMLVMSMMLVACGPKQEDATKDAEKTETTETAPEENKDEEKKDEEKKEDETSEEEKEEKTEAKAGVTDEMTIDGYALPYPQKIEKDGEAIEGGTLNLAVVADSPFAGIFHTSLYTGNPDYEVMKYTLGPFMKAGEDMEIVDGFMTKVEFDPDAKTATIKINPDLKWSDGTPVTADDYEWQFLLIAHPDYTGVRYDDDYRNIVGIEEYHESTPNFDEESDEPLISGVTKPDEHTVVVEFKEFTPSILWGSGLPYNPEPAHLQKKIPVADLETSDVVRVNPVSCGPYYFKNIVEGESVELEANPYWPGEKPKADRIIIKRTPRDTIVEAIKSGTFDVIENINEEVFENIKDLSNIELLSTVQRVYGYIGFKLGKWDADKGEVVMDPNSKMADLELRKAMAYAMNNDEVATAFYNDLRMTANTLITPLHHNFHDETIPAYEYNPEKAMEILDAAGYKDVDGDGFREDKDGNPLVINFASMAGGEIAEPLAQTYMQYWHDIGLNVELTGGRLIEFNAFYDAVENDDDSIDIYMAAWGAGSNPDPSGLYGRKALFNYPRYASEANDAALQKIQSKEAMDAMNAGDHSVLYNAYNEWQKIMQEELPVAPTHYRYGLTVINNRVKNFDLTVGSDFGFHDIELLSDTPEVAQ
ncbi:MAG: oligopeptide ABC transporter substrate-binding protein [Tissierellia bacterium]|nr:oligopeptide ABC transporter substrate-binding protein [Tissierellia bacterium]